MKKENNLLDFMAMLNAKKKKLTDQQYRTIKGRHLLEISWVQGRAYINF